MLMRSASQKLKRHLYYTFFMPNSDCVFVRMSYIFLNNHSNFQQ